MNATRVLRRRRDGENLVSERQNVSSSKQFGPENNAYQKNEDDDDGGSNDALLVHSAVHYIHLLDWG